jgi:hypothetical protein
MACLVVVVVVCLLGCSLPPVFINAVLELDDGEVADFDGERLVQEDGLCTCQRVVRIVMDTSYLQQWVEAACLLPRLQLLGSGLDLGWV